MIEPLLRSQLKPVANRHRWLRFWRELAICWAGAEAITLVLIAAHKLAGLPTGLAFRLVAAAAAVGAFILWRRARKWEPDFHALARRIEQEQPELHALLLTAVEQQPDAKTGRLNYLQERVIQEAILQGLKEPWRDPGATREVMFWQLAQLAALAVLAGLLASDWRSPSWRVVMPLEGGVAGGEGVTVVPGDASVERGSGLVVLARFEGRLPPEATLVTVSATNSQRLPLVKNLADPVFGGSIPEVTGDFAYRVEYGGQRTRDFKITVFEHPRLERADAQLAFPAYTSLPDKKIDDTRRVSAVEGTKLAWLLQLNKPVTSARLVAKDKTVVPLITDPNKPSALLTNFSLAASKTYELQLVDADGRTNKVPAQFVIDVSKSRLPELKIASPRGDLRPSALEEIAFQGEAFGDFGLRAYGLAYTVAGQEPKSIELGQSVLAKERRQFNYLLRLEDLRVEPDQLISWFIWADDTGPDGQVRRTSSDMYFAEVRPWDEIFRQGQSSDSAGGEQQQQQQQQQGQGGNQPARLAELQKQIINATWTLQRQQGGVANKPTKP